jgi:hypothetical protein
MIYQTQTVSFREELLKGIHDLLTDTIKLALYTSSATLNENTTVYSVTHEVTSGSYSAGGVTLTGVSINNYDGTVYVNFNNAVWSPASFTAAGGLIYNASKANRSIAVLSFGNDKTATNSFTVQMPANTYTSALLRFN